ncbi:MAG: hypothetical protein IT213_17015 [Cytophagales bacterium]|nr:hypothetical protein [Cytophagales bacterium]
MPKRTFLINEKGGVGKSYITKLLALMAEEEKIKTHIIDADNASASTTKYFQGISDRKSEYVLYKSENLVGPDRKIDRTKFDTFLETVSQLENVVVDFGAASSEQLCYYLQEESANGILEIFEELNIQLYVVIAGGGSIKESIDFFLKLKKIKGIEKIITIVANEKEGGVNGKSTAEYTKAGIQIPLFHEDSNSSAYLEWKEMMNNGVVYSDIQKLPIIRRKRITSYLNSIFLQIKKNSDDSI